jgi:predicted Rossmann fold flavoprotein
MKYNLIVIGGGPAGMMAAGRAAENGAHVLLIEKNNILGKKLLLTGKGRCNITHAEFNIENFCHHFGKSGYFLKPALYQFGPKGIIDFFEKRNVGIKVERGKRAFPESDKSQDVLRALIGYLKNTGVEIKTGSTVKSIITENQEIQKIILSNNEILEADKYALCSGGKSYPLTGSTGDGYYWLEGMGHSITTPRPALVSIIVKERFVKDTEGLSLKNVSIAIFQNNKKVDSRFGEALFTDNGMSGPIVLDMSKKIGELLETGDIDLEIDFKPALTFEILDKRLLRDFKEFSGKMFKNYLDELLPKKIIPLILRLSGIDQTKKINAISKDERKKIIHLLKNFKLTVDKIDGFENAIITAGGVSMKEVDPKTMKSKIIKNLYLAGEILDIDGPTGGFNLQVCWSTGFVIGENFKKN